MNKSQSQLIADVNLLHMQKRITEAERLRQNFLRILTPNPYATSNTRSHR